jgi:radical SAM protein (TIGR01212 family)
MRHDISWGGLPYYPISQFYKTKFGEKVYKIPVSTATTCPNREGLNGMKTCNFCDVWGSAAYPEIRENSLREQILETRERMRQMYKAHKFLVYFQAYTYTFAKVARLREQFDLLKEFDDVVGVVVGTRPDCLSDALFDLWNEMAEKMFLSVEIGVQSFNEEQLLWMRRGHTAEKSIKALHRIREKCPRADVGIHLMFGQPGETDEQIVETARLVNGLPINNVKLHNLHVLKNTPLEEDYLAGRFAPIDKMTYLQRCTLFLTHLSPRIAVHRLSALSNRPEELVAPDWTARKMETYQHMLDYMNERRAQQGQYWTQSG